MITFQSMKKQEQDYETPSNVEKTLEKCDKQIHSNVKKSFSIK